MTDSVMDVLQDILSSGHTVKLDGDLVRIRPSLPPEKREFLRQHKPELIALLKAGSAPSPKTYSRLELAEAALMHLIPNEQQRRKIRALAEADARNWRFLGVDGYQHILAGNIFDAVEQTTGKLICFLGCDTPDRFGGWNAKEIKH